MIETPSPAPHWFGFKQDWSNRVVKPKFHQQSRSESVSLLQPGQMCFMATHSSRDYCFLYQGSESPGLTHDRKVLVLIDISTPLRNLG